MRFRLPRSGYLLLFCDRVSSLTRCLYLCADYSVHSATLGKGKADDTVKKVQNGDLEGKGEVVMVFGKQVSQTFWPPENELKI